MSRAKLTLRPPPAKLRPHTPPAADPAKIGLSHSLGWRFIDRRGRYILQARTVVFPAPSVGLPDSTWVDVPLVPEVYG